ncbi:bifunctional glutamate N-acetyltransferase/amino-acid acetyltransferase ArgJ [candidate division FCPU426 bacterium]|nr:bifunctional glutamate N-acetyltransferase/amino-acid acetyltransferase ArgJ [candidate division FCPU426 bacterium]
MIQKKGLGAVPGFRFAALALPDEKMKLGLLCSDQQNTIGAAVYTRNDIKAAPVRICQEMDAKTTCKRAILVNSGNANAFTGSQGLKDARRSCEVLGQALGIPPETCYMASTGVIGRPLNLDRMLANIPSLMRELAVDRDTAFADAILTTDKRVKQASVSFEQDGRKVSIAACIKGAGMIMPNLATMLCFTVTNAFLRPELLRAALQAAVEDSFNAITVDSDTSTNDSVFILANGEAGHPVITNMKSNGFQSFKGHLKNLYQHLSEELIRDAEGATKMIKILVTSAATPQQAAAVGLAVANSPLVKTAFFGEQLNWGRIAMAAGKVMANIEENKLDIKINRHFIVKKGEPLYHTDGYALAEKSLKNDTIIIEICINQGKAEKTIITSDFSIDYIKINANYIN